jgi:hypothetical protein
VKLKENSLKEGVRSDSYLTHVCKLPWKVQREQIENRTFQPTLWLSSAADHNTSKCHWGRGGNGDEEAGRVRLKLKN